MESNRSTKSTEKIVGAVIAAILLCGVSFVGGMQYGKANSKPSAAGDPQLGQFGSQNGPGGFNGGGRMIGSVGTVSAVDSSSISVKDHRSGDTSTFTITSDTKVLNNQENASLNDIKVGDSVMVRPGQSDSKQAATIVLNPQMPMNAPRQGSTNSQDVQLQ